MSKIKVMKIEILVIDHDGVGIDGVADAIEDNQWPNRCITPQVKKITAVEVDWSDEHPLNQCGTSERAYHDLFPSQPQSED